MSLEDTLGARFAELRRDAGLTQEQVAEKCEVSRETIGRLERGEQLPSLERLVEIATALGGDLGEMLRRGPAVTAIDVAIERLVALLRRRSVEDAALVYEIATSIFRRYP